MDNESNVEQDYLNNDIKVELSEPQLPNTTTIPIAMNMCEDIKIEVVDNELQWHYEDRNFNESNDAIPNNLISNKKVDNTKNCHQIKNEDINNTLNIQVKIEKIDDTIQLEKNSIPVFFYCKLCNLKCSSAKILNAHMNVHDENRQFECDICSYRFKCKGMITRHMVKHMDAQFFCKKCDFKTRYKTELNRHVIRRHKDAKIPFKQNGTENLKGLKIKNIKTYSKDKNKIINKTTYYYKCTICSYKCYDKKIYNRHIKLHDLNRKFICDICFYRFKSENELKTHSHKHENKLKIKCNICGRKYKYKSTLRRHMEIHEGKEFSCNVCNKIFISKTSMTSHFSSKHTNSYKCNVCLKSFTNSNHYGRHLKMHIRLAL